MATTRGNQRKSVEALTHAEDRRRNLPSAEHQPLMREEEQSPVRVAFERRNRDLDPQLVWRGKDEQDEAGLEVNAPPLYIQERVHPKALIDDLMRQSRNGHESDEYQTDMFADFNGLPSEDARTEFYQHDANWSNRMILGDSLQVMASLATREGLRGKVQCIYIDPPYGIPVQLQLSVVHHQPRCARRQPGAHHPGAGAGQGLPRHLARRHPLLPDLSA